MRAFRWIQVLAVLSATSAWAGPVRSMLEIRQQNTVIQKWDISCGAAVLATILKYQHGLNVDERDVALGLISRDDYIANPGIVKIREGFSLLDMQRYAGTLGLEGVGLAEVTFEDLIANAPIVTTIDRDGYRHFVVVRGISGNRVLLIDPNFGNATMPREDFEKIWLKYDDLGHVGFIVRRPGEDVSNAGKLLPQLTDFWFFG